MTDNQETKPGLDSSFDLGSTEEAQRFYDDWSERYDEELAQSGYVTPQRCAEALARCATDRAGAVAELGCGTGLGGHALRQEGFIAIDGFDISREMMAKAVGKEVYRCLCEADLSKPLEIRDGAYANTVAIGVVNPELMPATVIDEMLRITEPGGCVVFSVSDKAAADGSIRGRIMDIVDSGAAMLVEATQGEHVRGVGLGATVYCLRKR